MLEEAGTTKTFSDGATIFRQGELGGEMYVVRSGQVRVLRTKDGMETSLATLKPGDFFGEMALFGGVRSASARAIGDIILAAVDAKKFHDLLKDPVLEDMFRRMGQRIRQVDEALEDLSVDDQIRKETVASLRARSSWLV